MLLYNYITHRLTHTFHTTHRFYMLPTVPTAYTQRFVTGLIHNLTAYKHNFTGYFTGLLWICRFPPAHPRRLHYYVHYRMFQSCYRDVLPYLSSSSSSSFCSSCSAIMSLALRFASMPHPTTTLRLARYARSYRSLRSQRKNPPTALAWLRFPLVPTCAGSVPSQSRSLALPG